MVTVTFKEDINITNKTFVSVSDFLGEIDSELIYEEYLERKLLNVKNKNNFINL